jgi:hypothetical protein
MSYSCFTLGTGYSLDGTDCNDSDNTQYPGVIWYSDSDGDSFGDLNDFGDDCAPSDFSDVVDNSDCDDASNSINPNATDICGNGIDENCSGFDLGTMTAMAIRRSMVTVMIPMPHST